MTLETSKTVRVDSKTHKALHELSATTGESLQDVVARAVEAYQDQVFFLRLTRDFAALTSEEWAEERAERRAWDVTLSDGLANE